MPTLIFIFCKMKYKLCAKFRSCCNLLLLFLFPFFVDSGSFINSGPLNIVLFLNTTFSHLLCAAVLYLLHYYQRSQTFWYRAQRFCVLSNFLTVTCSVLIQGFRQKWQVEVAFRWICNILKPPLSYNTVEWRDLFSGIYVAALYSTVMIK